MLWHGWTLMSLCQVKWARHRRTNAIMTSLMVPTIVKFIEMESRMVAARGWREQGTGAPPMQSASALPLSVTISGESGFLWGCSKSSSSKPGRSPEPPLPSPDIEEGTHTPSCDGRSGQEHPAIHSLWPRTRHPWLSPAGCDKKLMRKITYPNTAGPFLQITGQWVRTFHPYET